MLIVVVFEVNLHLTGWECFGGPLYLLNVGPLTIENRVGTGGDRMNLGDSFETYCKTVGGPGDQRW